MAKVRRHGDTGVYFFYCPACKCEHPFQTGGDRPNHKWTFNGDLEKPTFSPSLRVMHGRTDATLCHLFVRDGKIQYLGDCPHEFAGKTIDMIEVDKEGK